MRSYKSQLVGAAGTFALLAGMLGAAVAAPSATAPKMAAPKMAVKTTTKTHKTASHKASAKRTQVTGTIISIKGSEITMKPTMSKNGHNKTVAIPSSAKVTISGKSGRLSGLKAGDKVTVMMSGSKITSVNAVAASPAKSHKISAHKTAAHKTVARKVAAHKTVTVKPATSKAHI